MVLGASSWKVRELGFIFLEQKTQTLDLALLKCHNPHIYEQKGGSINASEELWIMHLVFYVLLKKHLETELGVEISYFFFFNFIAKNSKIKTQPQSKF